MEVSPMRRIVLSATACGLLLAVARIAVGNDFDVLLQDLSFGNEPEAAEPVAASAPAYAAADDIGPTPEGFVMPSSKTLVAATASTPLVAVQELIEDSDQVGFASSDVRVDFEEVFTSTEATETDYALAQIDDVPAPAENVPAPPQPEPMPLYPEPIVAAPITDPVYAAGNCNSCATNHRHGCENVVTCIPHLPPNLPHSTFLQYFRSNKCNSNVWQGYQQKCGLGHHHVQGTCDCFNPHRKDCFGITNSHCGNCDTCDR
jgi:hypothetical protein